ncbi:2-succinylbenzoate--CoA ligase [Thermocoleostomius sinensis]|uniref:2-succinylbenzoate--CoA ligase n=1 Tax=Thermocoleostomius sinensis A174 TaxID=2016057 RepID=A0A9E9CAW5_9CYAN|nr:2-succinylbenzoate--CoA ligase [Thermocoleostomius sinensis]WAL59435.1 2-succinylbenzoate--CoA ligase [Thermocoleostomius sinensis A174]
MAEPFAHWHDRVNQDWLVGIDKQQGQDWIEIRLHEIWLYQTRSRQLPTILLVEADPERFLAGFVAACSAGCPLVLGAADWGAAERRQALQQIQPDLIWGWDTALHNLEPESKHLSVDRRLQPGWILIPTGGSSGQIRFAIHTWTTLTASVQGFQQYFQVKSIHSCCVLPLYHVSGLMQFIRSFLSGGTFALLPTKAIDVAMNGLDPADFFLSLVPTQLQRLLHRSNSSGAIAWLRRFRTVLLGGAPAWPELLETARNQQIRLAPTYGMTETASQVATLKPDEFLQGKTGCGLVLPHAQIRILDGMGRSLQPLQPGTIAIQTTSLMLGYHPGNGTVDTLITDDVGFFDRDGYLHIVGRNSHKIITGGENVFPAEVEAAIRSTQLVRDVCVLGLPDPDWGEVVTAVYVPTSDDVTIADLQTAIEAELGKVKRPKRWLKLAQLPRSGQGKVNYAQLKQLCLNNHARQPSR